VNRSDGLPWSEVGFVKAVRNGRKKGGLARPEESLTTLNRLDRIWQLANFRL
jgi:hypothetical protein